MPLLKISESKKVTALVTIEDATARQIEQYAAMTKGNPDEVVQQALDYILSQIQGLREVLSRHRRRQAQDRASIEAPGRFGSITHRHPQRH
jgi:hypothetical protein